MQTASPRIVRVRAGAIRRAYESNALMGSRCDFLMLSDGGCEGLRLTFWPWINPLRATARISPLPDQMPLLFQYESHRTTRECRESLA